LIHDVDAPVRILQYFVNYGSGNGIEGYSRGGVGTTLTGIVQFTHRAESHAGHCHGGSMCSLLDDVVGWCAFLVTGECRPWSGFTVQINTGLKKPIRVGSVLLVKATIVRIDRRKVFVEANLVEPTDGEGVIHAKGDGLVVLNRGVLPLAHSESTVSTVSTETNSTEFLSLP
jgi:acyl-coenzyme A thioesterase PaaI-like protein